MKKFFFIYFFRSFLIDAEMFLGVTLKKKKKKFAFVHAFSILFLIYVCLCLHFLLVSIVYVVEEVGRCYGFVNGMESSFNKLTHIFFFYDFPFTSFLLLFFDGVFLAVNRNWEELLIESANND